MYRMQVNENILYFVHRDILTQCHSAGCPGRERKFYTSEDGCMRESQMKTLNLRQKFETQLDCKLTIMILMI